MAQLAAGADPTSIQIDLLASSEYFHDTGGSDLGFVARLYDDVLRHDPTPIEEAAGLATITGTGETGRSKLAQQVVLSAEARAIRVDTVFHALLKTYPDDSQLAHWVNVLPGSGISGISGATMIVEIAASTQYYSLAVGRAGPFISTMYQELLNRSPTASELAADSKLISEINAGSGAARLAVADKVVASPEFRTDEVTSYYANYIHLTCSELVAQECASSPRTPTSDEMTAALTALGGGSSEETVIATVLASDEYYQNRGSTQSSYVQAVYQDLLGRAPTSDELNSALQTYSNDSAGHLNFANAMVASLAYKDLLIALDYQQLLLRAPLGSELHFGAGVLGSDVKSLQTPDETLVETIISTAPYYADTGGTDSRFVARTMATLLMRPGTTAEEEAFLHRPVPHEATWQAGIAATIFDGTPEYRTDFVRGVYAKFLSYSNCLESSSDGRSAGSPLDHVPGGWFGLGVLVGVVLMGAGVATFFTLERRRFSRIYPNEVPRRHE